MSLAHTPDLKWKAIRAEINNFEQELALYVHLTGETSGMTLIYAGFDPNRTNQALSRWRRDYLVLGNQLSEKALLMNWPELRPIMARIAAGEFGQPQVFKPVPVVALTPAVIPAPVEPVEAKESEPMNTPTICQKHESCTRGYKHTGRCGFPKPEMKAAKPHKALPVKRQAKAPAAEVIYTPPPVQALAVRPAPAQAAVNQFEIKHAAGGELVHICTSNWKVARQAMEWIEQMQGV